MKLQKHGKSTLNQIEVTGVTRFGLWLLINRHEYFLSYKNYPWFEDASIKEIYNVELKFGKHLRWKDLDIDLELESLKNLEKYPLKYF